MWITNSVFRKEFIFRVFLQMVPHFIVLIVRKIHEVKQRPNMKQLNTANKNNTMNVCNVCVNNRHDHANASLFPSDSLFSVGQLGPLHWARQIIWKIILKRICCFVHIYSFTFRIFSCREYFRKSECIWVFMWLCVWESVDMDCVDLILW